MNEIRTVLTEVRDAVEAPPVDRLGLQTRIRAERRRRTTGRAAAGLLGVAAVTAVTLGVGAVISDPAPPTTDVAARPLANPQHLVGFVVDGRLVVGGPDGYVPTEVGARNVLGVRSGAVVLADTRGALLAVPVDDEGRPGEPERLLPGVVDRAWLAVDGTLHAERGDGSLVRSRSADGPWEGQGRADDGLYLVDATSRVESDAAGMRLLDGDRVVRSLPTRGGVLDGSLVAGTLALETGGGVRFYDAATGRRLAGMAGRDGGAGRLSPDASRYARITHDALLLVDPRTGKSVAVTGPDADRTSYPGEVAWTSPDTFVVVARGDADAGLWECDAAERTCAELYEDPTGTLQLHS